MVRIFRLSYFYAQQQKFFQIVILKQKYEKLMIGFTIL